MLKSAAFLLLLFIFSGCRNSNKAVIKASDLSWKYGKLGTTDSSQFHAGFLRSLAHLVADTTLVSARHIITGTDSLTMPLYTLMDSSIGFGNGDTHLAIHRNLSSTIRYNLSGKLPNNLSSLRGEALLNPAFILAAEVVDRDDEISIGMVEYFDSSATHRVRLLITPEPVEGKYYAQIHLYGHLKTDTAFFTSPVWRQNHK